MGDLTIRKERFGDSLDIILAGRLDTVSAQLFEEELARSYSGLQELNIDIHRLDYISSAGLRVLLIAQRKMNFQGRMCLSGAKSQVKDVLETTGFSQFMMIL